LRSRIPSIGSLPLRCIFVHQLQLCTQCNIISSIVAAQPLRKPPEEGIAMTTMQTGDLCLVTGVSGYLASWIAKDLLESGFRMRGTIRSLRDAQKVRLLRAELPGVELAEADLRSPAGWDEAVKGCRWVFHVASPQAVKAEKDRTGGATMGTRYLMRAAFGEQTVQKVVLTSSEAAIAYGHPRTKQRFTEDDWTILDGPAGKNDYFRSKTLAEMLAWELAGDAVLNPRGVALATINPGFIAGPSLVPWGRFTFEFLKTLIEGGMPLIPNMVNHIVDVRDCARMHVAVMNDPATNGHRHFSFGVTAKLVDMARVVRDNYAGIGFAPQTRVMPGALAWVLKFVSADVAAIYSKLGHANRYETIWPNVYRYTHTDLAEILKASMETMLQHGWITAARPVTERRRCFLTPGQGNA
jgi:nucleoside-diphosphate-sugar epimerase